MRAYAAKLPDSLKSNLHGYQWAVTDSNRRRRMPADLQSAPVGHLGNRPRKTVQATLWKSKPTMGIEPITYRLQSGCSAVELRRHDKKTRLTCLAPFYYTRLPCRLCLSSLPRFICTVNENQAGGAPPQRLAGAFFMSFDIARTLRWILPRRHSENQFFLRWES